MRKRRMILTVAAILIAASLASVLSSCVNISIKEPQTQESEGTGSAASPETDSIEPATENEDTTEPATEPADTVPAITPDPDGDAEAYAYISEKAEDDVRFRFVKAYIDGDGDAMLRTLVSVQGEISSRLADWVTEFEKYRASFKITRYDAFDGTETNEYGAEVERVVFTFSVYETGNDKVPVGEKEMIITGGYMDGTVWVTVPALEEKNAALRSLIPSDAKLLWLCVPGFRTIAEGYGPLWFHNVYIWDLIYLTLPAVESTNNVPGMTPEQISEAAKELFNLDEFDSSEFVQYAREDGLVYWGGHGGSHAFYELISVEQNDGGYTVRMRLYADQAYFIPSDLYEIRIKPSDGYYDWVFDYVRIVERGALDPFIVGQ